MLAMDFSSICRFCLNSNQQSYDIFTSGKSSILYCEMLSHCTKLQPCQGDGLPRLICNKCCRQLKKSYTFNIQCEESDKQLRCYLLNGTVPKIESKQPSDNERRDEKQEDVAIIENSGFDAPNNENIIYKDELGIKTEPPNNGFGDERWNTVESYLEIDHKKTEMYSKGMSLMDESSWDAEDDNLTLTEIKSKEPKENHLEQTKKKRGRKKKVCVQGEPKLPESKLPHQCDTCGKFLSTKSNLKAHKICHTDRRPFKCIECPATFKGHSALYQHKKVHTKITPYHCEFCPKQFGRRTGLVNHIRMHTGEKLFHCDICFKTFVQSAQLSIHMKRHKGDKPFLCQTCGKGFPIRADLKVHQRIHSGEKPYSCHLCTKSFATSGNLSIHVRIHNKEVRYVCKECNRGFVTCSSYNVHLKRHKGQKDYHCECGKTFYTSSALKQHKVVHTGEKKYQCKICDRKFTQTSHLSRHFKRDHAKPNAPVPSSDAYKIVLSQNTNNEIFVDNNVQKNYNDTVITTSVKCERL